MLTPECLVAALDTWKSDKALFEVDYWQNTSLINDPNEDYQIVFECGFSPKALDKAMIELWLTTDGAIAIGIERQTRIAERAHFKSYQQKFRWRF